MMYYILKTGHQMFDISRAYGLASILHYLSDAEVFVKDDWYYYSIEVKNNPDLENIQKLAILTGEDLPWRNVLLTLKNEDKQHKDKKEGVKKFLRDDEFVKGILHKYQNLETSILLKSKKKNSETLYLSMDISAAKGVREDIKCRNYSEGGQLFVLKEDFILSLIGHLHFTVVRSLVDKKIFILLTPAKEGIKIGGIGSLQDLKKKVEETAKTHIGGILPTLSTTAVNLAKEIYEMKVIDSSFIPRFSSLTFGVALRTKQQWKPYGGGIYPLDFLYAMIDSAQHAGEIFELWLKIFQTTNRQGTEDISIPLSEFLTYPSFESLERYLKIHLRYVISKALKLPHYEDSLMMEVLKCMEKL